MIHALLALAPLALASPPAATPVPSPIAVHQGAVHQEDERERPDPKVVAQAVEALKEAARSPDAPARAAALRDHGRVAAPEVVELVARGLRDRDLAVVGAAVEALRYNEHEDALPPLERAWRRDDRFREREQEDLRLSLVKAIGWHGSPGSVDALARDGFSNDPSRIVEARILALGNVRHPDAIAALVDLLRAGDRRRVQPYMGHFRMALMLLTGEDHGESQDAWQAWWNDHKKGLEVAPEAPRLPALQQRTWEQFWGLPVTYERPRKRGDRGRAPERP